jgi:hypothetical protein
VFYQDVPIGALRQTTDGIGTTAVERMLQRGQLLLLLQFMSQHIAGPFACASHRADANVAFYVGQNRNERHDSRGDHHEFPNIAPVHVDSPSITVPRPPTRILEGDALPLCWTPPAVCCFKMNALLIEACVTFKQNRLQLFDERVLPGEVARAADWPFPATAWA